MKSKIELSELIELIELANNPNTIHLADKLFTEKTIDGVLTTNLEEKEVDCLYHGLDVLEDRIRLSIDCDLKKEYPMYEGKFYCVFGLEFSFYNDLTIEKLKRYELNRRTNRNSRTDA